MRPDWLERVVLAFRLDRRSVKSLIDEHERTIGAWSADHLERRGDAYEVSILGDQLPPGQEIAEIGKDYQRIKTVAGIETRIPVCSIKTNVNVGINR